ncbi:MAG: CHASE2 domain-containing protein [Bacteroidia bacterium]|nr:CHASE2 domain-containing protein [Bacteroidia bacterium]
MRLSELLHWIGRLSLVVGGAFLLDFCLPPYMWGWDVHDLIYQRRPPQQPDTHIVIVDIGRMERPALAALISRLATAKPAFIGIDAIFPSLLSPEGDSIWQQALCSTATHIPLCIAGGLNLHYPLEKAPPQAMSNSLFTRCAEQAYANLILHEPYAPKTVREFLPYTVVGKDTHFSFGLRAALAIDPSLRAELPRWKGKCPINYLGNLEHFYYLSGEEVLRDTLPLEWLKNKTLLLGVADPLRLSMEDIFFSPLNPHFLRQSFPDMYGVVIHANIASMLHHRSTFRHLPALWTGVLLGLFYAFLSLIAKALPAGFPRWGGIRLLQVAGLFGAVELTLRLGTEGYWFVVEPLLWGILLGGEIELWRGRKP